MVGQIQNQSGGDVASVQLNLDWLDSNKVVVGHSSTVATRKVLANLDYSPFEDIEFPAAALHYDNFKVASITYGPSVATPYHLDAVSTPCPSGSPVDEVCGTVTNTGALTVEDVTAILTYTDSSPKTVGQDAWPVDNDNGGSAFAPRDQGHFPFFRLYRHRPIRLTAGAPPPLPLPRQPPSAPPTARACGTALRAGMPGVHKNVTLTNPGDGPLTITSFATDDATNFVADGSPCPAAPYSLPPGAQCPIDVTFAPVIAGPYAANLVVTDDAGIQQLPLTALASGPGAQLRLGGTIISSLDFGQVVLNTPSSPLTITLVNNGTEPLIVTALTTSGG